MQSQVASTASGWTGHQMGITELIKSTKNFDKEEQTELISQLHVNRLVVCAFQKD